VEIEGPQGREVLQAQAAYVLIGYTPDADFERRCGVEVDPETLVPTFDPETCESNVSGLYVAGTLQAGRVTNKIFIENSRDHGPKIIQHLKTRLRRG
jgi:thioredoxin reductase (NADPH)